MSDLNKLIIDIGKTQQDNMYDLMRRTGTPESVFPDIEVMTCDVIPTGESPVVEGETYNSKLEITIKQYSETHAKYKGTYFSSKYNRIPFDWDASNHFELQIQESHYGFVPVKDRPKLVNKIVNEMPYFSNSTVTPFTTSLRELIPGQMAVDITSHINSPTYTGMKTIPYLYVHSITESFDTNYYAMYQLEPSDALPDELTFNGNTKLTVVDKSSLEFVGDYLKECGNIYTTGVFGKGYGNIVGRDGKWLNTVPGLSGRMSEESVPEFTLKSVGIYPQEIDPKEAIGYRTFRYRTPMRDYAGDYYIHIGVRNIADLFVKQMTEARPNSTLNNFYYFDLEANIPKYAGLREYGIIVKSTALPNGQKVLVVDCLHPDEVKPDASDSQGLTDEVFKVLMKNYPLTLKNGQKTDLMLNQSNVYRKGHPMIPNALDSLIEDKAHVSVYQYTENQSVFFGGVAHIVFNHPMRRIDVPEKLQGLIDGSTGYHKVPKRLNGFIY